MSRRTALLGAMAGGAALGFNSKSPAEAAPAAYGVASLPGFAPFKSLDLTSMQDLSKLTKVVRNASYSVANQHPIDVKFNAQGFPLGRVPGTNTYAVHPTVATSWSGQQLEMYQNTTDRTHLNNAINALNWLYNDATKVQMSSGVALFAGYRFAWPSADRNPWYCAFGNSRVLQQFLQVWQLTKDNSWLGRAMDWFRAYLIPYSSSNRSRPWILGNDKLGYLWADEQPLMNGGVSRVINACSSGWNGVQTLQQLTNNPQAQSISRGILATMDNSVDMVRFPRSYSWYDSSHQYRLRSYHLVNVNTYYGLYNLTGHARFGLIADTLLKDWILNTGGYPVRVRKGVAHIVRKDGATLGPARSWTNTQQTYDTTAATTRNIFAGIPGVWLLTKSGPMAGYWFQEGPAYQIARGPSVMDRPDWYNFSWRPRPVWFRANMRITGYAYDQYGVARSSKTSLWPNGSRAHCTGRAAINGVQHLLIQDGYFAGMWVPEGQANCVG